MARFVLILVVVFGAVVQAGRFRLPICPVILSDGGLVGEIRNGKLTVYYDPVLSPYSKRNQLTPQLEKPYSVMVSQRTRWDPSFESMLYETHHMFLQQVRKEVQSGQVPPGAIVTPPYQEVWVYLEENRRTILQQSGYSGIRSSDNDQRAQTYRKGLVVDEFGKLSPKERDTALRLGFEGHFFYATPDQTTYGLRNPEGKLSVPNLAYLPPGVDLPFVVTVELGFWDSVLETIEFKRPDSEKRKRIIRLVMKSLKGVNHDGEGGQGNYLIVDLRGTVFRLQDAVASASSILRGMQQDWSRGYAHRLKELRFFGDDFDLNFVMINPETLKSP